MSAQIEEAVVTIHHFHLQQLAPDRCNVLFGRRSGRLAHARLYRHVSGRGERLAVDFAAGQPRQLLDLHQVLRDHVLRQIAPQRFQHFRRIERGRHCRHHPGNQPLVSRSKLAYGAGRFSHFRHGLEARFDLAQFQALATQFDLPVEATQIIHHAVRQPARQVASAIEAAELGVLDEALGSQLRALEIAARQLYPTQIQFTRDACRYRLEPLVEHQQLCIGHRSADRHQLTLRVGHAGPVTDVDAGFGRPVKIVQLRRWNALAEHLGGGVAQGLPGAEHMP